MRHLKALGSALLILGLCMFPAILAVFQLGAQLGAVDRMNAKARVEAATTGTELIGTYEIDQETMTASLRLHEMRVVHRDGR